MLARYTEDTDSRDAHGVIEMYKGVVAEASKWEEPHFRLAQYYDRILTKEGKDKKP